MQPAIKIKNISKRYRLGHLRGDRTLREAIVDGASASFLAISSLLNGKKNTRESGQAVDLWALQDISFEVMPGELLGLIGRNGAGKSTLLKVLSRITEPTAGRIEIDGRVGSLLEVGTGFNYELTGRENIFLSGAILGMRRAEIQRLFDEIVAFAGVEEFIDTPVKRYSTGMAVRLGFAVAAHLQAEILLIDEVLAVGDFTFQRKCIGKMNEIARGSGRTIVFVSHNMAAIESLCDTCLLLDSGRLIMKGTSQEALARYAADQTINFGATCLVGHPGRRAGSEPVMQSVELYCGDDAVRGLVRMGSPLSIAVTYSAKGPVRPVLGAVVKTIYGTPVFCISDRFCEQLLDCMPTSQAMITCRIDELRLMPATYVVDLYLGDTRDDFDVINDAISFEVVPADLYGTGRLPPSWGGPMFCTATWRIAPTSRD
jgi:lipopolysaccharide transport system ATP-binding protein